MAAALKSFNAGGLSHINISFGRLLHALAGRRETAFFKLSFILVATRLGDMRYQLGDRRLTALAKKIFLNLILILTLTEPNVRNFCFQCS